jgi:hypothetical protein
MDGLCIVHGIFLACLERRLAVRNQKILMFPDPHIPKKKLESGISGRLHDLYSTASGQQRCNWIIKQDVTGALC